jgi:hypothetical protein
MTGFQDPKLGFRRVSIAVAPSKKSGVACSSIWPGSFPFQCRIELGEGDGVDGCLGQFQRTARAAGEVGTGAECRALAGQHHDADQRISCRLGQDVADLGHARQVDGVHPGGAGDGETQEAAVTVDAQVSGPGGLHFVLFPATTSGR